VSAITGPVETSVAFGASQAITTTTELAVGTSPGLSSDYPGRTFRITAALKVTTGLGATGLIIRVRRGSGTGGALVGDATTVTAAASTTYDVAHEVEDSPGDVAGQQYTVTVQQVGATGNGTMVAGEAIVLMY